jgi:hypothetical protein
MRVQTRKFTRLTLHAWRRVRPTFGTFDHSRGQLWFQLTFRFTELLQLQQVFPSFKNREYVPYSNAFVTRMPRSQLFPAFFVLQLHNPFMWWLEARRMQQDAGYTAIYKACNTVNNSWTYFCLMFFPHDFWGGTVTAAFCLGIREHTLSSTL